MRIGLITGTLSPVLEQFDAQNNVSSTYSIHAEPELINDVHTVVNELIKSNSFPMEMGRKHKQFPNPKSPADLGRRGNFGLADHKINTFILILFLTANRMIMYTYKTPLTYSIYMYK